MSRWHELQFHEFDVANRRVNFIKVVNGSLAYTLVYPCEMTHLNLVEFFEEAKLGSKNVYIVIEKASDLQVV